MTASAAIYFPVGAHDHLLIAESGPWFAHRNQVIANLIKLYPFEGELYEIGAGNGVVSLHLQNMGYPVTAVEPMPAGAANCSARGLTKVRAATIEQLSLTNGSVGAIGAFDVLEHLQNPAQLLQEARRILKPNGIFYVTVPAHEFLWSSVDKYSGHFRRYSKKDLFALFADAGFGPLKCNHFMNLLIAPAFILRVLPEWLGIKQTEEEVLSETRAVLSRSRLMEFCLFLEKRLNLNSTVPFGTSLVGAFIKK